MMTLLMQMMLLMLIVLQLRSSGPGDQRLEMKCSWLTMQGEVLSPLRILVMREPKWTRAMKKAIDPRALVLTGCRERLHRLMIFAARPREHVQQLSETARALYRFAQHSRSLHHPESFSTPHDQYKTHFLHLPIASPSRLHDQAAPVRHPKIAL